MLNLATWHARAKMCAPTGIVSCHDHVPAPLQLGCKSWAIVSGLMVGNETVSSKSSTAALSPLRELKCGHVLFGLLLCNGPCTFRFINSGLQANLCKQVRQVNCYRIRCTELSCAYPPNHSLAHMKIVISDAATLNSVVP